MTKGKLIEQLTTIIEDTLQGNGRVNVSHDEYLKDDSGNDRQIDVLIEYFENDRFTFRTIIECKEKGRDGVEINQMQAFAGTFRSLPNVHKAIFVSTKGFQKGAINVAEKEGILLYTLSDLTQDDIKGWYKGTPKVSKTIKRQNIVNWRVLVNEKHAHLIKDRENFNVNPDEILHQDSGEEIMIRDLIGAIFPYWSNRLHNSLLNASIHGLDIYKEKYVDISAFQLKDGIYLKRDGNKIPIKYIELKILFWVEMEDVEQTVYKLYRDKDGKVIADVVSSKVDHSDENVYLNVIEDIAKGESGYYFIDGKKNKVKLEIDKEIVLPEKGQKFVIMKDPYKRK